MRFTKMECGSGDGIVALWTACIKMDCFSCHNISSIYWTFWSMGKSFVCCNGLLIGCAKYVNYGTIQFINCTCDFTLGSCFVVPDEASKYLITNTCLSSLTHRFSSSIDFLHNFRIIFCFVVSFLIIDL